SWREREASPPVWSESRASRLSSAFIQHTSPGHERLALAHDVCRYAFSRGTFVPGSPCRFGLHRHPDVRVGPAALKAAASFTRHVVCLRAKNVLARCGERGRGRGLALRGFVDRRL